MSESRLRSEDMPPELTEWFDRLKHKHKITERIEKEKAPKDGEFQDVYSAYCNDCGWSAPPDGFDVTWRLWSDQERVHGSV